MGLDTYNHIIITRFNLRHNFTQIDVNDQEWLENRFYLFERYCLPSVESQTCQNFKWLIFFDKDLPSLFKRKIAGYKKRHTNISEVYLDQFSFDKLRESCLHYVSKPYLITSRLDNDDIISNYYIERVQQEFDNQDDLLLDFQKGYCFNAKYGIINEVDQYISNPFMSYIERVKDGINTVFLDSHDKLKDYPNSLAIKDQTYWIIVIHEGNVGNKMIGRPLLYPGIQSGFVKIEKKWTLYTYFIYLKSMILYYRYRWWTRLKKLLLGKYVIDKFSS